MIHMSHILVLSQRSFLRGGLLALLRGSRSPSSSTDRGAR